MTTTRGGVGAQPAGEPVGYSALGGIVASPSHDDEARQPADEVPGVQEAAPAPAERKGVP